MTVRFRTTGAWGAGIGADLSPAQVDENFYTLALQIAAFTAPTGVGVASITVTGNQMTIHLTNATTQGPFTLPTAAFHDTGEWVGGHTYLEMDLFLVPDDGLYLVVLPYESPTEFDAAVTDTDGNPLLQLIIGIPPMGDPSVLQVVELTGDSYTLLPADQGQYKRVSEVVTTTDPAHYEVHVPIDTDFPPGFWQSFRQVGDRQIEFIADDTSVILLSSESLLSRKAGSLVTITHAAENTWDIAGDVEAL